MENKIINNEYNEDIISENKVVVNEKKVSFNDNLNKIIFVKSYKQYNKMAQDSNESKQACIKNCRIF